MFRELRRANQALSKEECDAILKAGQTGVLALVGDEGYPYPVPINYFYEDGKIYFHCAKAGHKIDAIKKCDKAGFCVIGRDEISAEEHTNFFKSVIVFGKIREIEDVQEMRDFMGKLSLKYVKDTPEELKAVIDRNFSGLAILELTIENITGKAAKEIINK